jgi:alpha-tubulin suppressor-like RCC1 family protein
LGNGVNSNSSIPVAVSGISTATAISGGGHHTCALLADATVKCWGYNNYGQLGRGDQASSNVPVQASGLSGVTSIGMGYLTSLAVLNTGAVVGWGFNDRGQLGPSAADIQIVPIGNPYLTSGVSQVMTGYTYASCALKTDQSLVCWGSNGNGALGDGQGSPQSLVPVWTLPLQ